jgi:hypothetical protein
VDAGFYAVIDGWPELRRRVSGFRWITFRALRHRSPAGASDLTARAFATAASVCGKAANAFGHAGMRWEVRAGRVCLVMYARAVDAAEARLRELRYEEREDLGLAALALGLAVAATQVRPALAVPLFLGGLAVGALGVRALWRRWDLVERLAGERDAYVISEVLAFASREATMERRHSFAAFIRSTVRQPRLACEARVIATVEELEALASELDDGELALDPVCAVACMRLVSDLTESPLRNPAIPPEELRSRVRLIRAGFWTPRARNP